MNQSHIIGTNYAPWVLHVWKLSLQSTELVWKRSEQQGRGVIDVISSSWIPTCVIPAANQRLWVSLNETSRACCCCFFYIEILYLLYNNNNNYIALHVACSMTLVWWKSEFLLGIIGSSTSVNWLFCHSRSNVRMLHLKHFLQLLCNMSTSSRILKKVEIIMVDLGTWYYPPLRLRCLYISNLGDQAAGLQSWSTQWLAINRLGSIGRAQPWQRFPCGYGLWHRGTCPKPSALIWQMILYQRPLHWFGW